MRFAVCWHCCVVFAVAIWSMFGMSALAQPIPAGAWLKPCPFQGVSQMLQKEERPKNNLVRRPTKSAGATENDLLETITATIPAGVCVDIGFEGIICNRFGCKQNAVYIDSVSFAGLTGAYSVPAGGLDPTKPMALANFALPDEANIEGGAFNLLYFTPGTYLISFTASVDGEAVEGSITVDVVAPTVTNLNFTPPNPNTSTIVGGETLTYLPLVSYDVSVDEPITYATCDFIQIASYSLSRASFPFNNAPGTGMVQCVNGPENVDAPTDSTGPLVVGTPAANPPANQVSPFQLRFGGMPAPPDATTTLGLSPAPRIELTPSVATISGSTTVPWESYTITLNSSIYPACLVYFDPILAEDDAMGVTPNTSAFYPVTYPPVQWTWTGSATRAAGSANFANVVPATGPVTGPMNVLPGVVGPTPSWAGMAYTPLFAPVEVVFSDCQSVPNPE